MDDKRKQTQSYARKTLIDSAFVALGGFLLVITRVFSLPTFILYMILYQIAYFIFVYLMQKRKQRKQAATYHDVG